MSGHCGFKRSHVSTCDRIPQTRQFRATDWAVRRRREVQHRGIAAGDAVRSNGYHRDLPLIQLLSNERRSNEYGRNTIPESQMHALSRVSCPCALPDVAVCGCKSDQTLPNRKLRPCKPLCNGHPAISIGLFRFAPTQSASQESRSCPAASVAVRNINPPT